MNYVVPFLKTQKEVADGIKARLRDTDEDRWEDAEVYRALNDSMSEWAGRVFVPYIYTITGGFLSSQSTYSLPSYIPEDIQPQRLISRYWDEGNENNNDSSEYIWVDVQQWGLEPDGEGGQTLRVEISSNQFSNTDGRVLWWGENGFVPESVQALNAGITSSDTSLTIAAQPFIPDFGYIKIGNEWMLYAGVTYGASTLTLTGLTRAVRGTAASHSADDEVLWGVAAPQQALFAQLNNQLRAHMHELLMTVSSTEETQQHQWQMRWNQQKADEYWMRHTPNRSTRIRIGRRSSAGATI